MSDIIENTYKLLDTLDNSDLIAACVVVLYESHFVGFTI